MKSIGFALFVAAGAILFDEHVALLSSRHNQVSNMEHEACVASSTSMSMSFDDYVARYGRDYEFGSAEYDLRQPLFESRQKDVIRHNCHAEPSWSRSVNHLSDRTDQERSRLFGWKHHGGASAALAPSLLQVQQTRGRIGAHLSLSEASFLQRVNWNLTTTNVVKDQGECGSCWAHAAMNLLEAHQEIFRNVRHPVRLSMQDFIDCVKNPLKCGGTGGCEGATVELAIDYAVNNIMNTADRNFYQGFDTNDKLCKPQHGGFSMASIGLQGYKTYSNELRPVLLALQSGPVAVAIEANDKWYDYEGGIVDGCDTNNTVVNHAVLLTGYGEDKGQNYWNLLNSWTKNWGEKGSVRTARQKTWRDEEQHCARDLSPQEGVACAGGPKEVTVCGTCGVLYDVVALEFSASPALRLGSNGLPAY